MVPQIKLRSDDGQLFEVSPQIHKCFKTINLMLQDPFKTKAIEEVVPVPDVNASSLQKVLEWAEYHIDEVLEGNDGYTLHIREWDRQLLQVKKTVLIELVLAANYLGFQELLDIAGKAVIKTPRIVENSVAMDADFIAEQQQKEYFNMTIEYDSNYEDGSDDEDK